MTASRPATLSTAMPPGRGRGAWRLQEHQSATSAASSISTQAPSGICATPKALRACVPASPGISGPGTLSSHWSPRGVRWSIRRAVDEADHLDDAADLARVSERRMQRSPAGRWRWRARRQPGPRRGCCPWSCRVGRPRLAPRAWRCGRTRTQVCPCAQGAHRAAGTASGGRVALRSAQDGREIGVVLMPAVSRKARMVRDAACVVFPVAVARSSTRFASAA